MGNLKSATALFIGIPAYGGIQASCIASVNALRNELLRNGIECPLVFVSDNSLLPDARNRLLAAFLQSGATHALFLDADISFQPKTAIEMLSKNREFLVAAVPMRKTRWDRVESAARAGTYPLKTHAADFNVAVSDPNFITVSEDGLIQALFAGTAFMMLRRSVVERMMAAHPELIYETDALVIPGLFNPIIENRRFFGEDFSFCKRWTALGGEIWVFPDAPMAHCGPGAFEGNLIDLVGMDVVQPHRQGSTDGCSDTMGNSDVLNVSRDPSNCGDVSSQAGSSSAHVVKGTTGKTLVEGHHGRQ